MATPVIHSLLKPEKPHKVYAEAHRKSGDITGKSDGGKTCAKAFVHCGILKPVKA